MVAKVSGGTVTVYSKLTDIDRPIGFRALNRIKQDLLCLLGTGKP